METKAISPESAPASSGSMTLPPSTKHVWCWDRLKSTLTDACGSTKDVDGMGEIRRSKITEPSGGNADHDVALANQHVCHVCQYPSSYHEYDLMKENPVCLQCIGGEVLVQLEILPIGELIEWFTTYVTWIESGNDEEGMIKDDFKRNVLFHFTVWAESLLSAGFSRPMVKDMYRLMARISDEDLLSTHIKGILSDYNITFQSPQSFRVSIVSEVCREQLDDILDSAEELKRMYESDTVPGQEEWFHHYSSSVAGIWSSSELRPSVKEGHIKFGYGVYFTQLSPCDALASEIRENNYDGSSDGLEKVCAAVKIPKGSVEEHIEKRIDPKREHRNIWILPTRKTFPLPSGSRIEFYENRMISRLQKIPVFPKLQMHLRVNRFVYVIAIFIMLELGLFDLSEFKYVDSTPFRCFYTKISKESGQKYIGKGIDPGSVQSNAWHLMSDTSRHLTSDRRIKFYDYSGPYVHYSDDMRFLGRDFLWLVALGEAQASMLPKFHTEGKCSLPILLTGKRSSVEGSLVWCFYTKIPKESLEMYLEKGINTRTLQSNVWLLLSKGTFPLPANYRIMFYDYVPSYIHYSDDTLNPREGLIWLVANNSSLIPTVHTEGKCTYQLKLVHGLLVYVYVFSIIFIYIWMILSEYCTEYIEYYFSSPPEHSICVIWMTIFALLKSHSTP